MTAKCILCGSDKGLNLDLSDGETFTCQECGETFTEEDIEEQVKALRKLLLICRTVKSEDLVEA